MSQSERVAEMLDELQRRAARLIAQLVDGEIGRAEAVEQVRRLAGELEEIETEARRL